MMLRQAAAPRVSSLHALAVVTCRCRARMWLCSTHFAYVADNTLVKFGDVESFDDFKAHR